MHLLVMAFAGTILLGTVLLRLPPATRGQPLTWLDALFTATSAVCVTGLVVVDTGTRFSPFGQGVILVLIQAGGLGIMTMSTFVLFLLGRRTTLGESEVISDTFGSIRRVSAGRMVALVVTLTFVAEGIGAVSLYHSFSSRYETGRAVWYSIFHSVSAFCNAGFSLFPDYASLTGYAGDVPINMTVMLLIVTGGLGAPVVYGMARYVRVRLSRRVTHLDLHAKLVLGSTALLIVGGALVFWLLEHDGTAMQARPTGTRVLDSFFQSVTARTAGFNTVDFAALSETSLLVVMALMFIGGSPGSTAGGIKTTTAAVAVMALVSRLRGKPRVGGFGRTIPEQALSRVFALMVICTLLIGVGTLVLEEAESVQLARQMNGAWTTVPPGDAGQARVPVTWIAFEVVSAFGTVGLSTGITPYLSWVGKSVLIVLMFAGRLGPLTFVRILSERARVLNFSYPEEDVYIG